MPLRLEKERGAIGSRTKEQSCPVTANGSSERQQTVEIHVRGWDFSIQRLLSLTEAAATRAASLAIPRTREIRERHALQTYRKVSL